MGQGIDDKELRRRAIAGVRDEDRETARLLAGRGHVLERGFATASLQATRAGAPLYERLGFSDLGFIEMWELRR